MALECHSPLKGAQRRRRAANLLGATGLPAAPASVLVLTGVSWCSDGPDGVIAKGSDSQAKGSGFEPRFLESTCYAVFEQEVVPPYLHLLLK